VPKTAEGVLGLTLYDFCFERKILDEGNEKFLKSGIRVSKDQPPNKNSGMSWVKRPLIQPRTLEPVQV
jgi:hypothetical protein